MISIDVKDMCQTLKLLADMKYGRIVVHNNQIYALKAGIACLETINITSIVKHTVIDDVREEMVENALCE